MNQFAIAFVVRHQERIFGFLLKHLTRLPEVTYPGNMCHSYALVCGALDNRAKPMDYQSGVTLTVEAPRCEGGDLHSTRSFFTHVDSVTHIPAEYV